MRLLNQIYYNIKYPCYINKIFFLSYVFMDDFMHINMIMSEKWWYGS